MSETHEIAVRPWCLENPTPSPEGETHICASCTHYEPDRVNPVAGLGDCPDFPGGVSLLPVVHKGEVEHYFQKRLPWPGTPACEKFEE